MRLPRQVGLRDPLELVTGFERSNLTLAVTTCRGREEKTAALSRLIADIGTPDDYRAFVARRETLHAA